MQSTKVIKQTMIKDYRYTTNCYIYLTTLPAGNSFKVDLANLKAGTWLIFRMEYQTKSNFLSKS